MKINTSTIIKFVGVLALPAIIFLSCKKQSGIKTTFTEDATVIDAGAIAPDGCGWEIKTGTDSVFSPVNLATQYQINNLKVHISYEVLDSKFQCGSVAQSTGITQIQLDAINKIQ
jgi:hypothetical protein